MSTRSASPDLCGGVDEAEDVVENIPVVAIPPELESLGEGHGLFGTLDLMSCQLYACEYRSQATYQKCASYQNKHAIIADGLYVEGVCAVLDLLEGKVLP